MDGNCKPLSLCDTLYKIYQNKPVSNDNKLFLKSSRCEGASNNTIYVCCPDIQQSLPSPNTIKAKTLLDLDQPGELSNQLSKHFSDMNSL